MGASDNMDIKGENNMKNDALAIGGNAFGYVLAIFQSNEVWEIISFALAILSSCVIIAYKVWQWYREAKKDGKITPDEVATLIDDVGGDVENIKQIPAPKKRKDGKK